MKKLHARTISNNGKVYNEREKCLAKFGKK